VLAVSGALPQADSKLFGESVGSHIDIFSVLAVPYEPVVFSSLMHPIAEEWAQAKLDPNTRQSFWRWRRARPLAESVPVAPPIRRAMVRGWFTGLALGQVRVSDALSDGKVDVWIPTDTGSGGQWAAFPSPFLRAVRSSADTVGAVLESLPIALLDVYSSRSVNPLRPYHQLTALGTSGSDGGIESYEQLNRVLSLWIRDGSTQTGCPVPDGRVGYRSMTPEMRRDATERRFADLRDHYRLRFEEIEKKGDLPSVPRDYELRSDVMAALDDLVSALAESAQTSDGVEGGKGLFL
jgi:hypothetical protein